jgi:hypothetical protein
VFIYIIINIFYQKKRPSNWLIISENRPSTAGYQIWRYPVISYTYRCIYGIECGVPRGRRAVFLGKGHLWALSPLFLIVLLVVLPLRLLLCEIVPWSQGVALWQRQRA